MKTNRPYLSWSQYSTFKSSKKAFHDRYVLGKTQAPNRHFEKGKELGRYLETGEIPHWVEDELLEPVGAAVPRLDIMEHKLEVDMFADIPEDKKPAWAKPLLAFIDTGKEDGSFFNEYKTGKEPWTQDRVDNHKQLDFYAVCYFLKTGKIPVCKLVWIETKEETVLDKNGEPEEVLRYTGLVEEFTRIFTTEEISNMSVQIMTTMSEIDEYEYEGLELKGEEDITARYAEVLKKFKDAKEELDIMKLSIHNLLESEQSERAVGTEGYFAISKRKSYNYSSKLMTLKATYAKEIKKQETAERNNGTATMGYSESIRFVENK